MILFLKQIIWRPIWRSKSRLSSWYHNKFIIPPYSEKRELIVYYKTKYNSEIFVETGTYLGDTVEYLKNEFKHLISIELSKELASKAKNRFRSESHINIIQGDSGEKISEVLPKLQVPTLFWLDGHYSGEFFVGEQLIRTAKSNLNTPILNELGSILKHGIKKNVILIDDARYFNGTNDYPSYNKLVHFVAKFNIQPNQITKKRDIIRIVPTP